MFKKIMYLFGRTINCTYSYKKKEMCSVTKCDEYFDCYNIGQIRIIELYRFY